MGRVFPRLVLGVVLAGLFAGCGGADPPGIVPDSAVGPDGPAVPDGALNDSVQPGDIDAAPVPDATPPADAPPPIACGSGTADFIGLGSSETGTTIGAPNDTSGSCGGAASGEEVFFFILTTAADATISTDHPITNFNSAVYVRSVCDDLSTQLGCASGGPQGDSVVITDLEPGTYFVFVDGVAGSTGNFEVSVSQRPIVAEGMPCDPAGVANRCQSGTTCIDAGAGPVCLSPTAACEIIAEVVTPFVTETGNTTGVADSYQPACSTDGAAGEIVYRVDIPTTGDFDLLASARPTSFMSDGFDPILTAEAECGVVASAFDCSDSPGAASTENVAVLEAEGTVFLLVDGFNGSDGAFELDVTLREVLGAGAPCDPAEVANRCGGFLACVVGPTGATTCQDPYVALCAGATAASTTAPNTGSIAAGTSDIAGSCGGAFGNEVLYYVDVLDGQYLTVSETQAGITGRVIYLVGPGTCSPESETACDGGAAPRAFTTGGLGAGRYTIVIDGGTGLYSLNVTVGTTVPAGGACELGAESPRCGSGLFCLDDMCATTTLVIDTAPNAAFCDAQGPFASDFVVDGDITGGTDFDMFEVTVAAVGNLVIETANGITCGVNTLVEVYAAGGLACTALDMAPPPAIASDNDSGIGLCSFLTVPVTPGTYYVRVRRPAGTTVTGPYFLVVDLQ